MKFVEITPRGLQLLTSTCTSSRLSKWLSGTPTAPFAVDEDALKGVSRRTQSASPMGAPVTPSVGSYADTEMARRVRRTPPSEERLAKTPVTPKTTHAQASQPSSENSKENAGRLKTACPLADQRTKRRRVSRITRCRYLLVLMVY